VPQPEIPTNRPLTQTEVHSLMCECILSRAGKNGGLIRAPQLIDVGYLAQQMGLSAEELQTFCKINEPVWTHRKLSEFVNRLISRGILSRAWEQSHADVFYFVSEYGLSVLQDIGSLLDFRSTEFVESLRDPELRDRCADVLNRTKFFDSMVRDAIAVLEDRLKRNRDSAEEQGFGVAFRRLHDAHDDGGQSHKSEPYDRDAGVNRAILPALRR